MSKAAAPFLRLLAAAAFPLLLAVIPAHADVEARVVSVHDGDTLTVLIERKQVKVRLTDIDAPELGQPFGRNSKQSLSDLCFGKIAAHRFHASHSRIRHRECRIEFDRMPESRFRLLVIAETDGIEARIRIDNG